MLHLAKRAILTLIGCASAGAWAAPGGGVPPSVTQVISAQRLPQSAVSFSIIDADSGLPKLGHNPDTPRSPASTVKVVTTFAALDLLGPSFTWRTRASIRGEIADGILDGDLILQGGGDPYMTLERWWSFAHALRARGLKTIHGDIVIDNSAYSLPPADPGEFDGRPNRPYNVLPAALMVNFQSIDFRVVPDAGARRIDVIASPDPVNLTIKNHVHFVPGRCGGAAARVDFEVASASWDVVVFGGALSPHCAEREFTRVLLQPATYAYGTFVELWRELGGEISGSLRVEPAAQSEALLSFDSLSLGEIVRLTNKFSSNLMARHLLLTIGGERFGYPATLEKGAAAIAEWSAERGFDLQGVDIDNGSGLSRSTHISTQQMGKVLAAAYRSRYAPEFLASLPLAGVDGTLRSRMRTLPAGAVRLKTGHLDGVSGVAGYVTAGSGKTYVLVSLVNHPRADFGAGEPVHAALVTWILENL
jgi:D-alanyl-D-alanine carboxypeptidase/D-alanyl-D-alanine-endopeptidase (penicillin-binding protein 4)